MPAALCLAHEGDGLEWMQDGQGERLSSHRRPRWLMASGIELDNAKVEGGVETMSRGRAGEGLREKGRAGILPPVIQVQRDTI